MRKQNVSEEIQKQFFPSGIATIVAWARKRENVSVNIASAAMFPHLSGPYLCLLYLFIHGKIFSIRSRRLFRKAAL